MPHENRRATSILGCSPMTFFLFILSATALVAIFKSYLPGPYVIIDRIYEPKPEGGAGNETRPPTSPPTSAPRSARGPSPSSKSARWNPADGEGPDPWDWEPISELRELPPQLPETIFGTEGVPKFYTDSLFIMQYNSRRYERMHQWRQRLHFNEHLVNSVALPDDQIWPAEDPGVFHCGYPAEGGMMAYECVSFLMEDERFLAVDQPLGYLFFHFDIITRFSHWAKFNLSQFHAPKIDYQHRWFNGGNPEGDGWYWWGTKWGTRTLVSLYGDDKWKEYLATSRYMNNGQNHTEFKFMSRGFADIYWVPSALSDEFRRQSHIFRKHEIFTEVAAPMQCILFTPEFCDPAAGIPFPGKPVCDIQGQPHLSWIHRADWTKSAELAWWDTWHLQPSNWIPSSPPEAGSVVLPYESNPPCYTKYPNMDAK